jgi:hypothetical protein
MKGNKWSTGVNDPSLFDSKCVLTDEQIEIIKQKWAETSNHKSSASF